MLSNMALLRLIDRLPVECGMVLFAKDFPPPPRSVTALVAGYVASANDSA